MMQLFLRPVLSMVGGIAAALFASSVTLDSAMRDSAPALALRAWPMDGLAKANLARESFQAQAAASADPVNAIPDAAAIALSKAAIVTEPLASEAVALIAFGTSNPDRRFALLQSAVKMNRRDAVAQSRLLVEYERRGQADDVFLTINRMLKVHPELQGVYSNALANALIDPNNFGAIERLLKADPKLANIVLRDAANLENAVGAAVRIRRSSPQIPMADRNTDRAILSGLLRVNDFASAFSLFDRLKQDRFAQLDDASGAADTDDYPPIDWIFTESGLLSAQKLADQNISVHIAGGEGGVLGRRLIALPPGEYQAGATITPSASDVGSAVFRLNLACAEPDVQTNQIEIDLRDPNSASSRFTVPAGLCRYFWIELYGSASLLPNGVDAVVRDLGLMRMGVRQRATVLRLS